MRDKSGQFVPTRQYAWEKLLPLWHKLTQQEVAEYSPLIASRRALLTDEYSTKEIALAVEQILRGST